ncbi:MAG: tRNA (adenosine(37)-N6)-threonylcarbamoyltransferase complex transferase subunit TsaD [Erysipelothrix sp.]|jgi:N6-L-threonylcarbamoyladenine synthase|nr:tRNA (adenosine(37)-N6)-threonylcarbamoyltransferase complex transferase subunit TsaD [Erysipelothrix sp.]
MNKVIICAIETSCDETSVALVQDGNILLSQVTHSQIQSHQIYKGVMPELASRLHIQVISQVIEEALNRAQITWSEVNGIAFTIGPGLVGSLHVGAVAAKTLAWALNKPLMGVNHLAGHIHANAFVKEIRYPCLALVVSGGHTELIMMRGPLDFEVLSQTQDDAIGEAYDKVGRLLGLNYPAGPYIDELAKNGQVTYPVPTLRIEKDSFSYSGIKSHFNNLIHNANQKNEAINVEDMCATFQDIAVSQIIERLDYAIELHQPKHVIIAGGVSANSYLRAQATNLMKTYSNIDFSIPPITYCTDNAAMIGAAAYHYYLEKRFVSLNAKVNPGLKLT